MGCMVIFPFGIEGNLGSDRRLEENFVGRLKDNALAHGFLCGGDAAAQNRIVLRGIVISGFRFCRVILFLQSLQFAAEPLKLVLGYFFGSRTVESSKYVQDRTFSSSIIALGPSVNFLIADADFFDFISRFVARESCVHLLNRWKWHLRFFLIVYFHIVGVDAHVGPILSQIFDNLIEGRGVISSEHHHPFNLSSSTLGAIIAPLSTLFAVALYILTPDFIEDQSFTFQHVASCRQLRSAYLTTRHLMERWRDLFNSSIDDWPWP